MAVFPKSTTFSTDTDGISRFFGWSTLWIVFVRISVRLARKPEREEFVRYSRSRICFTRYVSGKRGSFRTVFSADTDAISSVFVPFTLLLDSFSTPFRILLHPTARLLGIAPAE